MSATQNQSGASANSSEAVSDKGKGKAVEQPDISMEEESSDEEESAAEDVVSPSASF